MAPRKAALNGFGRIGEPPLAADDACSAVPDRRRRLTALAADRRRCMVRCRRPPPPALPPGRLAFRLAFDSADVQIVHVNEPTVIESSAYLLKYDSVHGA
jgi:hypothetical protein